MIEALLWTPTEGGYLLEYPIERLANSAKQVDFSLALNGLRQTVTDFEQALVDPQKIRILLSNDGEIFMEAVPLGEPEAQPSRVGLAKEPIQSSNLWLYHKTTNREMYASALASRPDCSEVILWNERGEITETNRANIVLQLDDTLVTPPISSGLLGGTFRACLLKTNQIEERAVTIDDLHSAEKIYLINSVRKWREGVLVDDLG